MDAELVTARKVVVAYVVVEFTAVTFCRVVDPRVRRFPCWLIEKTVEEAL